VLTSGSKNGLLSIEKSVRENRETFNRESEELSLLQSSLTDAKLVEAEYIRNQEQSGILELRLKGFEKTIDSLSAREVILSSSVNQLKKDQSDISQDNSDSRELFQKVKSRLEAEENKLRAAQLEIKRAVSDRDNVQEQLVDQEAKEAELALKITGWQAQEATLTASISLLQSNESGLRNAESAMKVRLATAENSLDGVTADLLMSRRSLSELKENISITDRELKKLEIEILDKAGAVTALRIADEGLDGIKTETAVLGERKANLLDDLASLKNEIKVLSEQQRKIHGDHDEIAILVARKKLLLNEIEALQGLLQESKEKE